jgi:hypothetical protein
MEILSDTHAHVLHLRAAFAAEEGPDTPPFVLATQLYSVIDSRTVVDRELERLRLDGVVRVFELSGSDVDVAVMVASSYVSMLTRCRRDAVAAAHGRSDTHTAPPAKRRRRSSGAVASAAPPQRAHPAAVPFDALERVAASCRGSSVSEEAIERAFRTVAPSNIATKSGAQSAIGALVHCGLISGSRVHDGYDFSVPRSGAFVAALRIGRAALLKTVERRKFKEIPEDELLRAHAGGSYLSNKFLLRDALGSYKLVRFEAASGPMIALPS